MKFSLTAKLSSILALGLALAFLGQILIRYNIELPEIRRLETESDARDIERVRMAIFRYQRALIYAAEDHGEWDDTYEFMQSSPGDPVYEKYIAANIEDFTLEALNADGVTFISKDGSILSKHRHSRIDSSPEIQLPEIARMTKPGAGSGIEKNLVQTDIIESNIGVLLYATSYVLTSKPPFPEPNGVVFFWRLLDEEFFNTISRDLQLDIRFLPVSSMEKIPELKLLYEKIKDEGYRQLPRDNNGNLYWILYDSRNTPLFVVQQGTANTGLSKELLSSSVIVGFASSALVLVILVLVFSRTVITRLLQASALMVDIVRTGDYGRRLPCSDKDELDAMFRQFNQLLGYIEKHNQELLEQNQELSELSEQDALTGIPNRRFLDEVLDRTWRQCARSGDMMSVLMIDVDFFKPFNDAYGHPAGDKVLVDVARTLQNNLHRASDYVARYGGEEFCVILTDTNTGAAMSVAERLRMEIQKLGIRSDVSKCADVVTVSIGVAAFVPSAKVVEIDILKAADEALYDAKSQGRNRVHLSGGMKKSSLLTQDNSQV